MVGLYIILLKICQFLKILGLLLGSVFSEILNIELKSLTSAASLFSLGNNGCDGVSLACSLRLRIFPFSIHTGGGEGSRLNFG